MESRTEPWPGPFRIGLGHDTHRTLAGRPLVIGGVRIEHSLGLDGHSDADVLLHAVTDALLGAAGLGDIGDHFPDTDPQYKGVDSARLLQQTLQLVEQAGWRPVNVDCTVHAQQPKLGPHKLTIRKRLSHLLKLPESQVNVKAKTGERVGPIGREEAMCAEAIVLLQQQPPVTSPTATQTTATQPIALKVKTAPPPADVERTRNSDVTTLRVYNTLTRQKELFKPVVPGQVGMYLCGPTVYKPAHIGHMVGPVIFDTIKRYLAYSGFNVKFVINITDVDDKLIVKAAEKGTTVEKLAREMTQDYFDNLSTMGVDSVDCFPYATEHIPEMLDIIQRLIDKGFAYPLDGDVYFHVPADKDYGKLSRRIVEETLAGTRIEAAEQKKNAADFALWKRSKPGEPAWDSPWGAGRPGWHIECSAMSMKYLGETLDIHGGGLDLMFPHHENELAQSECCTGKTFATYWLHNGLMQAGKDSGKVGGAHSRHGDLTAQQVDQEAGKIAGSKGAASVKELFKVHHPETIRFFLLSTHYRSPIDFSDDNILQCGKSLEGFYRLFESFEKVAQKSFYTLTAATQRPAVDAPEAASAFEKELVEYRQRFIEAMDDDFNTGAAVAVLFDLRKTLNSYANEHKLDAAGVAATHPAVDSWTNGLTLLRELSNLLGVFRNPIAKAAAADDGFTNDLMQLILDVRAEARKSKNFATSDMIRDRLNQLKVIVEDRPDGVRWRRG